jgi:hypothetical protein
MLYQLSYVRAVSILPFFPHADAGFAASAAQLETPLEVIMAREAGRTSSGLVGDDDRRAELHVMEEPLRIRNVHADAAV